MDPSCEHETHFIFCLLEVFVKGGYTHGAMERWSNGLTSVLAGERRQFKQRRSARTYQALLEAAETVFARRGYDAAQTPEIAAEAGVSTGAFYRYFVDKRQAFVEMIAHHLERAHADVMAKLTPDRFGGQGARGAIDVALDVLLSESERHAALQRVFIAMSMRDRDVEQLRAQMDAIAIESLASQ
jgi:AcrR family transcriptional regulator